MSESTDFTYRKNRDVILNIPKDSYENNKQLLREQTRDKYRNLSEEEKKYKKENMRRINITICLMKINKNIKNIKKIIV